MLTSLKTLELERHSIEEDILTTEFYKYGRYI